MVEEALAEHATLFYKVDSRLSPSPYRDLWAEWGQNDEERERCVRAFFLEFLCTPCSTGRRALID